MKTANRTCAYCGKVLMDVGSICEQCLPFVGRQRDTLGLFLADILAQDGDPVAIQIFDEEFLKYAGIKPD